MKLSLCAIVKDDAIVVPRLLNSVVTLVDEIVIADTGSTDNTVEVIEEFANEHPGLVKILHFEWINDFSAARNFVLDHASGDWVLVLDADEFLGPCDKEALYRALETTPHDGLLVKVRNYMGSIRDLKGEIDVDSLRLFRSQYRYVGSVHEQISASILEAGGSIGHYPLVVHHIGYTEEYRKLKQKTERNTNLLKEQIKSIPKKDKIKRWFALSNLLAEYHASAQWADLASEARLLIEEIRKEKPKNYPVFLPRIYKLCVFGLRNLGRMDDALRTAREAVSLFPKRPDTQLILAETYIMMQRYVEAMEVLQVCQELGDMRFDIVEYQVGSGTYIPASFMAYCWMRLGDDVSARDWYVRAFAENTALQAVIPWIVMLTPDQRVLHEMEKVIHTPQRYEDFVQAYTLAGYEDALSFIEKAERRWGERESFRRARFAYDVRHGRTPALPSAPRAIDHVRYGLWLFEQGEDSRAIEAWQEAGPMGEYLTRVVRDEQAGLTWEMKHVFHELLAARATRLLTERGAFISDLHEYFMFILHTDVLSAFTNESFLQMDGRSPEEWEWKAQVYLQKGQTEKAKKALEHAVLPDGHFTVRGYIIAGDIEPEKRNEYLRTARKRYPNSLLLKFIWLNYFAPTPVPGNDR